MSGNTTTAEAEALWADLRGAFANLDGAVKAIIDKRAWEPLGYATLSEAWADRMSDVPLSSDLSRAYFVYSLLDDMPEADVRALALGTPGIGPTRIDWIIESHRRGIPAEAVSTVRRHLRRRPTAPHVIRVVLSPDEFSRIKGIAEGLGVNLHEEAEMAVRVRFAELGAVMA